MTTLQILEYPDPRLRTVAKPVTAFDAELRTLAANMLETMYAAEGIGLAATQVNVHKRLLVIDISQGRDQPLTFVNPTFEVLDETLFDYTEGCLSVPGFYEDVARPRAIQVTAQDVTGKPFSRRAEDLLSICVQHEIDHLNGKLFVDYLSALKRNRIRDKLVKGQRKTA